MGLELREIQSPIFSEPLDFTFHAQSFTLLVGSSGSGKSSLFQMIAQVSSLPYSGQILIDGSEVSQLSIIHRTCPDGWYSLSKSQSSIYHGELV
ncbi:cobalt or other cation ABC transporter ATP-binding protein [Streptococcus pneumoniae]|nr:cobalt or other cation ABC transporter ATP-binding protein [Streptococcus pneumoniae]CIQ35105.1 cobalt or other cation ABC transporter ATP-binding protein [Streptococcus pneumoniae]